MSFPVFDLHCDTALSLLGKSLRETGSLLRNEGHFDLERAQTLPGFAQCFACFTTPFMQDWYHLTPEVVFEREMVSILREIERNKDRICLAYTAQDVKDNFACGLMSGILTIEGPAGFGFDPLLLEDLYKVGFRMTTLGWNEDNLLTGSHVTGGGLTQQGREYVFEAQRLGMIVDVSHISDAGFWDIVDITQAPIIASHSNSRAVCGASRNLTDEMFKAICETGGVAGFNQCASFVGDKPDLDTACDHILHFMELDPDARHIALGGDLDGCDTLPDGFKGVQDYPKLACKLMERGLDDVLVRRIFWENALGVMEACSIQRQ